MVKIAVLVPHLEMCELATALVGQYSRMIPMCVEYTGTEQVQERARELERQGCELIVARGLQATLIKRCVKLPVVEIRITAQELGTLILDIRKELGAECPKIGLIGFENMLCETDRFNDLFHIEAQRYMVESEEQLYSAVNQANEQRCQAVIGGEVVCERAKSLGMMSRFIPSGAESIKSAFDTAERVCYAIDLEKSNSAEMNTMLDFTFSGIMQVDLDGRILRANRITFNLLNERPRDLLGKRVQEALPQLESSIVERALQQGKEAYAFLLPIQKKAVVVNVAPITIDEKIRGAILTFQESSRIREIDGELRRELYRRGFIARFNFDTIICKSPESKKQIELAKRVAKYRIPLLLSGEVGAGKSLMAQCIHNESLMHNHAFVSIDCSAYPAETMDVMLFGNYSRHKDAPACMVEMAQNGTLYLAHVEALPMDLQHRVLDLMQGKFLHNGASTPIAADVRVIASTHVNLTARVERGEFRSDFYYALSVIGISVSPLRRCREDIPAWIACYLEEYQKKYKRYVTLTQGAQKFLADYSWPGNLYQLRSICERTILLAEKRSVDEVFFRRELEQMAPKLLHGTEQIVLFQDQKAVEIAELLRKYGGNRQKVADALGISKTTLWRQMKKYGIARDFSYSGE